MTPAHMASPELVVVCGDGTVHGYQTFATVAEAQRYAERLPCPARHHRIVREGVLAEAGL